MEVKMFEVLDTATFIPVVAINPATNPVGPISETEVWLWARAGFGDVTKPPSSGEPYVILMRAHADKAAYDPFDWGNNNTMYQAHRYIIDHWHWLASGDVIDVEFISGRSQVRKISERLR